MLINIVNLEFFLGGIFLCTIILGTLIAYLQRLRRALQENEERFRAVSTYNSDWEILLASDGKPLWVNATAEQMTGLTDAEALAMPNYPLPLIAQEDLPAIRSSLLMVATGGVIDDQLLRIYRADNTSFRGSLSAQKIFSAKGKLLGTRLNIRDVSTLTHYQEEMERKRQLLQALLDSTNDGIIALDSEFRVIYFNTRYLELWELSDSFLKAQPTMQEVINEVCRIGLYPPEAADAIAALRIEHLTGGGEKIVLITPRQDGVILESFATPLPGHGYLLTYRDVTAQTLAAREILSSREHYRTVIETVPHGIIEYDLDGRIRYANASYGAIVGREPAQLLGHFIWEVLSSPESAGMIKKRFEEFQQRKGPQPATETFQLQNSAGVSLWRQVDTNILRNEKGEASGYISIVTDITERKTTQIMLDDERILLNTLIQSLPDPVWLKDLNGKFLACNAAFSALFNDTPSNIIGRRDNDYVSDEMAAFFQQKDRECIAAGQASTNEEWVTFLSNGHQALWETTKTPVLDLQGQAVGSLGVARDITVRKEIEESLRANERKFRAIFDQAFQFSGILDPEGRVLEVNRSALDLIAGHEDDVRGKFFWETPWWKGHPAEAIKVRDAIRSCAWGNSVRFETSHRNREGQEKHIDFSIKPIRDEWGQIIYVIPEGRDITELKEREKMAMLMAHGISAPTGSDFFPALCRSLIEVLGAEHAFIGRLEGDEVGIIAGLSHGNAIESMRYKLAGTPCAAVMSSQQACIFPQRIQALFPDDHLLQCMTIEGYAGSPLCASDGTTLGIITVLYDRPIENLPLVESLLKIFVARAASELERHQAEAILEESERRYRALFHEFETIFNGIPDSLTVWSSEMRLIWANSSSTSHYGVPASELAGKSCQDVCTFHLEHDPDCEIRRCLTSGKTDERIRKALDGRSWGIKTFPLHNADGRVDRVIRVASDLTERMILREEAVRAAHLAALGELAAGMAHEINNPTSLILLEMPILLEVFKDIVEILEEYFLIHGDFPCGGLRYSKMRIQVPAMLIEILDSAERIKHIVEELRDFSHPTEATQFTAVDLNEVARKALSLVSNQIKKSTDHFTVIYAPTTSLSLGTLQRLEQVLINLILNACQALPDRGCSLSVEVGFWPDRRRNFIRVSDGGIGIQPEHLKLITDPFFTTRRSSGGTGLGLSVSSRIIEEHGGTLHFVSEVGKGTTVTIELPMIEENEPS